MPGKTILLKKNPPDEGCFFVAICTSWGVDAMAMCWLFAYAPCLLTPPQVRCDAVWINCSAVLRAPVDGSSGRPIASGIDTIALT